MASEGVFIMKIGDDSQNNLTMREAVETPCIKCGRETMVRLEDLRKSIIVYCGDCKKKNVECDGD